MGPFRLLCLLSVLVAESMQATVPEQLVVEGYFILDKAVVSNYMSQDGISESEAKESVKADTDYFITQINEMYSSLSAFGVNIIIKVRKLTILETNLFDGPTIDVFDGLDALDAFLRKEDAKKQLDYDLAILLTGSDIVSGSSKTVAGFANVGRVCEVLGASGIVEFSPTFKTVSRLAHELGHVLGAGHDKNTKGNIMYNKTMPKTPNRWFFSEETAQAVKAKAEELKDKNCMVKTSGESVAPNGKITPGLEDPNKVCQREAKSNEAFMFMADWGYDGQPAKGDAVCKVLLCARNSKENKYAYAFTSNGMICGKNQRCKNGKCVTQQDAASEKVDDSCPYGDQRYLRVFKSRTEFTDEQCAKYIEKEGAAVCKDQYFVRDCCQSCKNIKQKRSDPEAPSSSQIQRNVPDFTGDPDVIVDDQDEV